MTFDPDGVTSPDTGIFGLPTTRADAGLLVIPAPFDGTTSFGTGCGAGPDAVRRVSNQIDLYDHDFGRVHDAGIHMTAAIPGLADLAARCRALADRVFAGDDSPLGEINAIGEEVESRVHAATSAALEEGKIPVILGGEHSVPLGAVRAASAHEHGLGVLQIDAHMDLHRAYAGMTHSHASIAWNILERLPSVTRLVQVGIRDYAERERRVMEESGGRVVTHFDADLWRRCDAGASWADMCFEIIEPLPERVYVTFDIDGLDPSLCPGTGTPVPGGLSMAMASELLVAVARSGRRIVAADLVEVAPRAIPGDTWDANVGGRVLYKLLGSAAASRGLV